MCVPVCSRVPCWGEWLRVDLGTIKKGRFRSGTDGTLTLIYIMAISRRTFYWCLCSEQTSPIIHSSFDNGMIRGAQVRKIELIYFQSYKSTRSSTEHPKVQVLHYARNRKKRKTAQHQRSTKYQSENAEIGIIVIIGSFFLIDHETHTHSRIKLTLIIALYQIEREINWSPIEKICSKCVCVRLTSVT